MTISKKQLSRRTMFLGTGTIGAVAAVATLLPSVQQDVVPMEAKAPPKNGGGYQLTDHVRRYYQAART